MPFDVISPVPPEIAAKIRDEFNKAMLGAEKSWRVPVILEEIVPFPVFVRAGKRPYRPLRVTTYDRGVVHVWLRFNPFYELDVEEVQHVERGLYPEWLFYELNEGWQFLLQIDGEWKHDDVEWRLRWMMEHGIAPGQRFRVEIKMPRYPRYDPYDDSGPDYYDPKIVEVEPWSTERATRAYERATKRIYNVTDLPPEK